MIRSQPSNLARILVALVSVPPKYHFNGPANTTAVKEPQIHIEEILRKVFVLVFRLLDMLFNTTQLMLCAVSRLRKGDLAICT
jgi:hypothetical protein